MDPVVTAINDAAAQVHADAQAILAAINTAAAIASECASAAAKELNERGSGPRP